MPLSTFEIAVPGISVDPSPALCRRDELIDHQLFRLAPLLNCLTFTVHADGLIVSLKDRAGYVSAGRDVLRPSVDFWW